MYTNDDGFIRIQITSQDLYASKTSCKHAKAEPQSGH